MVTFLKNKHIFHISSLCLQRWHFTHIPLHPAFFLMYVFLIEGLLPFNIVLVSAIPQHEAAIGIHMSPLTSCFFKTILK